MRQGPQGDQGVRRAQPRVAASVHDLQQLYRELHVPDAAAAALDLGELLASLADVFLEPHLRASHIVDRGGCELGRVHERLDPLEEPGTDLRVARDRPRLDHGLALPRRGLAARSRRGSPRATAERAVAASGRSATSTRSAMPSDVGWASIAVRAATARSATPERPGLCRRARRADRRRSRSSARGHRACRGR